MTAPAVPDLAARILAAVDDAERAARYVLSDYAAHDAAWTVPSTGVIQLGDDLLATADGPLAEHIARHDPAAVLRRCAADRRILQLHPQVEADTAGHSLDEPTGCVTCHNDPDCGWTLGNGVCDTVMAMAEGYGVLPGASAHG